MESPLERLGIDSEKVSQELEIFIKTNLDNFKKEGVVIGLSGGIDSGVVLALSVAALGPDKVLGLIMPERDSSQDSEPDARVQAEELGIKTEKIDLTPILESLGIYQHIPKAVFSQKKLAGTANKEIYKIYSKLTGKRPLLSGLEGTNSGFLRRANAYYRMKHRVRMVLLYSYGERENMLVMGTANKTESLTGFFVKYGDGSADIMPLLKLYKTQVKQLARHLKVPDKIINKAPSPDLIPGITDEFAIGMPYEKLDIILSELETNTAMEDIVTNSGEKQKTIEYVKELIRKSEPMRILPISPS